MTNSDFSKNKIVLAVWALLALAYLIIRFGFTLKLESYGAYSSYVLEIMIAIITGLFGFNRKMFSVHREQVVPITIVGVLSLLAGAAAYWLAGRFSILVPFDLTSAEAILFLLIVAPILEELIFRFVIWSPLENYLNRTIAWAGSSILFSYAHYHAIWFYPEEIHPFILYQSAYTLVLGFVAGYFVWKSKSVLAAILVHFCFNLGFYLYWSLFLK